MEELEKYSAFNEGFFSDGGKFDRLGDKFTTKVFRALAQADRNKAIEVIKDKGLETRIGCSADEIVDKILAGQTLMQVFDACHGTLNEEVEDKYFAAIAFDDVIGYIKAKNEDEAYEKLEKAEPYLPYNYFDASVYVDEVPANEVDFDDLIECNLSESPISDVRKLTKFLGKTANNLSKTNQKYGGHAGQDFLNKRLAEIEAGKEPENLDEAKLEEKAEWLACPNCGSKNTYRMTAFKEMEPFKDFSAIEDTEDTTFERGVKEQDINKYQCQACGCEFTKTDVDLKYSKTKTDAEGTEEVESDLDEDMDYIAPFDAKKEVKRVYNNDFEEVQRLAALIGIDSASGLDQFMRREALAEEEPLDALRRYILATFA